MIQTRSKVLIVDKTSGVLGICIKILKGKKVAKLGDVFLLSIRVRSNTKARFLKLRLQKRFSVGTIHRGLLIRAKFNFFRFPGEKRKIFKQ